MFSNLAAKAALQKVGLPTDIFNISAQSYLPPTNRLRKKPPPDLDHDQDANGGWASWMSAKSLPLTVQPWLTPPPPPVAVAPVPTIGDVAPVDRHGEIKFGGGRKILLVFLRCVGCACK